MAGLWKQEKAALASDDGADLDSLRGSDRLCAGMLCKSDPDDRCGKNFLKKFFSIYCGMCCKVFRYLVF